MKGSTEIIEGVKRQALVLVNDHPGGVTVRRLQRLMNIRPDDEGHRRNMWRLVSAMASLTHDRYVTHEVVDGVLKYFPIAA